MNLKLALCLVAALLLAGALLYLTGERGGAARARGGTTETPPAPSLVDVQDGLHEPGAAAPSSAPPAAIPAERHALAATAPGSWRDQLAHISGRVVESDGSPVPAIRVALLGFSGSHLFDGAALGEEQSLEIEETTTDAEGRFVLGGADREAFNGLGVDLAGPRATLRVIDQALVHGERVDLGDVVLAPFGILTGRVLDEQGAPVAGARVRCAAVPPEILVAKPQEFRSDSVVAVNATLLGGRGHYVIEPPGWIAALIDRLPFPTTQTGADGSFRLAGVPLAQIVGGVDKRGLVGVTFGPLDLTGGAYDLGTLVLEAGVTVRGVVEDSSGDAVAGAEVRAGAELVPGIVAILQPCGASDAEGRFELRGVAEGAQIVAAARRSPSEAWSTAVSARPTGMLLELEPVVGLTVNVRDEAGEPISGADLRLEPAREEFGGQGFGMALSFLPRPASPPGAFKELEPGRYRCTELGAGRYELTARVAGRAPAFVEVGCLGPENEVTLVSPAGRRIELTVVDAHTREPLAGARASVMRASSSGFVKLGVYTTDGAGRALLGPLGAPRAEPDMGGDFPDGDLLLVEHPRHGDHSAELDMDVSTLLVELSAGGVLTGRVHWGGAPPQRPYMLMVEPQSRGDGLLEIFHLPRFTVTGLEGEFRLANLAPGKHGVELTDRFLQQDPLALIAAQVDSPTLYRGEIEIRDGETTELAIDLTPSGRGITASIAGRVRFAGRGLEGAKVSVNGNEDLEVTTEPGGRFETPPFSVHGTTWIQIEGDVPLGGRETQHLQLYRGSVQLAQGDVHEIDLDLYPSTVRARVVNAAGEPVPGASVSANLQNEENDEEEGSRRLGGDSGQSDESGEVKLLVLEHGSYVLQTNAKGFRQAHCTVTVNADGTSEPGLLRLEPAIPCAGRVRSASGGAQTGFAYVWVHSTDGTSSSGARLELPDYTFELEGLAPGEYTAQIFFEGQRGQASFTLGPEGSQELVLDFVPEVESEREDD